MDLLKWHEAEFSKGSRASGIHLRPYEGLRRGLGEYEGDLLLGLRLRRSPGLRLQVTNLCD